MATINAWLSVRDARKAVEFYKTAFGASETYRVDNDRGVVARLSIGGAEFWVADESPEHGNSGPETLNGTSVRMMLIVDNPDEMFPNVIAAGATEVWPVSEGHGWRLGRVCDPYGHHWEIGHPIA